MAGTLTHRATLVRIEARSIPALDLACAVAQVGVGPSLEVGLLAPARRRILANLVRIAADRAAGSSLGAACPGDTLLVGRAAGGAAGPDVRAAVPGDAALAGRAAGGGASSGVRAARPRHAGLAAAALAAVAAAGVVADAPLVLADLVPGARALRSALVGDAAAGAAVTARMARAANERAVTHKDEASADARDELVVAARKAEPRANYPCPAAVGPRDALAVAALFAIGTAGGAVLGTGGAAAGALAALLLSIAGLAALPAVGLIGLQVPADPVAFLLVGSARVAALPVVAAGLAAGAGAGVAAADAGVADATAAAAEPCLRRSRRWRHSDTSSCPAAPCTARSSIGDPACSGGRPPGST